MVDVTATGKGGPEDHFTASRELYVLVEGDEWAHVEALDPEASAQEAGPAPAMDEIHANATSVGARIPRQAARGGREPATAPFAEAVA